MATCIRMLAFALPALAAAAQGALAPARSLSGNTSDGNTSLLVVEPLGKSPNFKIYPEDNPRTFIRLKFGKIQEVQTGSRKGLPERSIMSLAAEKEVVYTQTERVVGGANATVLRMEVPIAFERACRTTGGGDKGEKGGKADTGDKSDESGKGKTVAGGQGGDAKKGGGSGRLLTAAGPKVAIEVFIFQENATITYGSEEVSVSRGQMKFNIESAAWPFCNESNSLQFQLAVVLPQDSETSAKHDKMKSFGDRKRGGSKDGKHKGKKGKEFRARAGGKDVLLDLPELALIDGTEANATVGVDSKGSKTVLLFQFPYFSDTLLYDPTVGFEEEQAELDEITEGCSICTTGDLEADNSTSESSNVTGAVSSTGFAVSSSTAMLLAAAAAHIVL